MGRQLAIVLDGELKSAPVIRGAIEQGRGKSVVIMMCERPLNSPTSWKTLSKPRFDCEESSTGPTLGRDSIEKGVRASLWGMTAVAFHAHLLCCSRSHRQRRIVPEFDHPSGVLCNIDATLTLPVSPASF